MRLGCETLQLGDPVFPRFRTLYWVCSARTGRERAEREGREGEERGDAPQVSAGMRVRRGEQRARARCTHCCFSPVEEWKVWKVIPPSPPSRITLRVNMQEHRTPQALRRRSESSLA